VIVRTGCPIDDTIAVRTGDDVSLWRTGHRDVLVNALGAKAGLVDPAVAWAPTVVGLTDDRRRLVVAFADLEGHRLYTEPETFDAVIVQIPGQLTPIDTTTAWPTIMAAGPSQWSQLQSFLATQVGFAVRRGEFLDARPLLPNGSDPFVVTASAEPGDHLEHGHGFYVWDWNRDDNDDEPIAPYRQSSLEVAAAAMCDFISTWNMPPIAVTTDTTHERRGTYVILA